MVPVTLPSGFRSDGCTIPADFLRGIMGADEYRIYCVEHDFLRRHEVVHWFRANLILAQRIASKGFAGILRAPFYLIFTTVSYPWYSRTVPLPSGWEPSAKVYQDAYS